MKVSLIIPTRNEENCIGKVLQAIPRKFVNQIIIVDGNSTDNTISEVKHFLTKTDRLINQKGSGYGAAFLQGFKSAIGDVIIMMDGDGSQNPKDIPKLLKQINLGFDYVSASRYIRNKQSLDDTLIRYIGNRFFTWLTNFIYKTNFTDCLYLYTAITKKGLKKLKLSSLGFEFCIEIIIKAHLANLKIIEISSIEKPRIYGKSKVNAFLHGLKILYRIIKII